MHDTEHEGLNRLQGAADGLGCEPTQLSSPEGTGAVQS